MGRECGGASCAGFNRDKPKSEEPNPLSLPKTWSGVTGRSGCDTETPMIEFLTKLRLVARSRLKSRASLEAEHLALRLIDFRIKSNFQ